MENREIIMEEDTVIVVIVETESATISAVNAAKVETIGAIREMLIVAIVIAKIVVVEILV